MEWTIWPPEIEEATLVAHAPLLIRLQTAYLPFLESVFGLLAILHQLVVAPDCVWAD